MRKTVLIYLLFLLLLLPALAPARVIESDTTWSGEVSIDENILIPKGVTLTISPGTSIRVMPSEGTKTDPEFISFLTEITVRGTLKSDGKKQSPVTFLSQRDERSGWAGVINDGGKTVLRYTVIRDAEAGVDVIKGSVSIEGSTLTNNRYGLTVQGKESAVTMLSTKVKENDYGLFLLNGARIESKDSVIKGNRKKDSYTASAKDYYPLLKAYNTREKSESTTYGDEVFLDTVVWQGRIKVNGIIRVPLSGRIIILPGTVVEFSKKDTNNDGIGENGLFIQGGIIAKGTKEKPILFRSAEKDTSQNDWDSINILNSDRAQNLIEYCQIENAYRGLHFHFANVAVKESVIRNNSRGIQFQESIVEISGTHFYDNNSALWARDSEINFYDNLIYHNYSGINFFRNTVTFMDNSIMNNVQGGLRVREGLPVIEKNMIDGNRYGMLVVDSVYGTFKSNIISNNLESGISLRGPVNIEISGNVVQGNGLYGINIQEASAVVKNNLIADNEERGIGIISFNGIITENNIFRNGLYNLGIDGKTDVSAKGNWWGEGDIKNTIYDKYNDPSRGKADYMPIMEMPAILTWPLSTVQADTTWQHTLNIKETVTVQPGIDLAILPDVNVLFSEGAGLVIQGRIFARGEKNAPVTFSSYNNSKAKAWDEIRLEHADGSVFSNCIIENATWALHIHFTGLTVQKCLIKNNYGGLRFRSGPVDIMNTAFERNEIGLRSNRGIGILTKSLIADNRIGIFIREKGSGIKIRRNNFRNNSDYNIRVGDFNDEDVDAKENWWGDAGPGDTIFDERFEPGIGAVQYEPEAVGPYVLDLLSDISQKKTTAGKCMKK